MTTAEYNLCVDKYADKVYRFILRSLNDTENSKDIVQEAFTRMWEKVDTISYEKSKSYLFTTAYHIMIDFIRKNERNTSLELVKINPESHNMQWSDIKEILNEAVTRLPEAQKSALLLRDYEGYSYKEIGDILKLSESQVKVYIYRARMAMKTYLGRVDLVV